MGRFWTPLRQAGRLSEGPSDPGPRIGKAGTTQLRTEKQDIKGKIRKIRVNNRK